MIILIQLCQIPPHEKDRERNGHYDGKKSIHRLGPDSEEPQQHRYNNVDERQYGEGVAERFMRHMPQLEHLLGVRKKYDAPGKQSLSSGQPNHSFELGILRRQSTERTNRGPNPITRTLRRTTRNGRARSDFTM